MAEKDEFYGVRKAHKSSTDCQDQAGSSVGTASVKVNEGSHRPENATYSTGNAMVDSLYARLAACPDQPGFNPQKGQFKICIPTVFIHSPTVHVNEGSHRPENATYSTGNDCVDSLSARLAACPSQPGFNPEKGQFKVNLFDRRPYTGDFVFKKHSNLEKSIEAQPTSSNCVSCFLTPVLSSSMVLQKEILDNLVQEQSCVDGSMVYRLREGVGFATNNVAEYRALILGLKYALKKGFKHICVQGDSKLVCMQIQGLWKTGNQNMAYLCNEARELKDKFVSFQIQHVDRGYNFEADAQANLAISLNLKDGQVQEECSME